MDLLKRQLAPITSEAWDQIDDEAKRVLALHLAGRKLVDFTGPHGWQLGGVNTGRLQQIAKGPVPEVGHAIAEAKEVLRIAGVNGPYALAAGIESYDELIAAGEDGYPLQRRVEENLGVTPIVWAPALRGGAVLMSTRGGDYELTVGQDLSIGYAGATRDEVELYITESFTFRVLEDKAAIFLRRGSVNPPPAPPKPKRK